MFKKVMEQAVHNGMYNQAHLWFLVYPLGGQYCLRSDISKLSVSVAGS